MPGETPTIVKTDVLVVGGGGAACRAAVEAKKAGATVVVATKGTLGAIGTRGAGATASANSEFGVFATPGWTGPISELEKPLAFKLFPGREQALANIIQVGLGMADPHLAQIVVEEAAETRSALLDWRVTFGEPGIWSHGVPIAQALVGEIRRTAIPILERIMIVSLLISHGECCGAVGIDERTANTIVIEAGATVVATGGDANLFLLNLSPPDNTGDGYAIGYEAGAELVNMEFKQIFLGTIFPTRNMLVRTLLPGVKLLNKKGEEFLQRYLPGGATSEECLAQRQLHNPFSTRDSLSRYVDVAILGEVEGGRGTDHSGVWLDRTDAQIPPLPQPRLEFWQYRGIDFAKGPVEIGVCQHSALGGFRIDDNGQTTVPYLYAAGEVAAGPHGADRMAGHMLLAGQVFGARAGKASASRARDRKLPDYDNASRNAIERIASIRAHKGSQKPADLKASLQRSAYFNLLVARKEERLKAFLDEVKGMRNATPSLRATGPQELVEVMELHNLLLLAEIEAAVCLKRPESRGPHYREDFPEQNDTDWLKSITVKKIGEKQELGTIAFDPDWINRGDEDVKMWG